MILIIEYNPSDQQKSAPPEIMRATAEQIASIDGLRWKYWVRSTQGDRHGGIYLFDTPQRAQAGALHLQASLVDAGARDVNLRFFEVDTELSAVTRGLIPQSS